jgi:putative CocE/NonD family hydrolase
LQAAALQPPALRAVIAVCATDDRWATDAHWMGGCLLLENFTWGAMCMTLAAQPPDPVTRADADAWRSDWLARLDAVQLLPARWMRHMTRDAYWRHGSVNTDWTRIRCPVYAVSGWADAYADAVPRLMAGLSSPRKGLIGPWAHLYPHEATPHPAIGFLQEAKRWWDRHLRGIDTGIDDEPMLRVWMQEHPRQPGDRKPAAAQPWAPGRWVAEAEWPSQRITPESAALAPASPMPAGPTPQTVGGAAGPWCAFGIEVEPFPEQTPDDSRSWCMESAALERRLEVMGAAVVELDLAVDRPAAFVVVRLCDVAPDGDTARVAYALLDLAQRRSDDERSAVTPGERMRARIELRHAAHSFAPGHRVRVAVSSTYWPVAWPSPEPVMLAIHGCALELPVRPADPHDVELAAFAAPESAATDPVEDSSPSTIVVRQETEPGGIVVESTHIDHETDDTPITSHFAALGLASGHGAVEILRIAPDDPISATIEIHHRTVLRRDAHEARVALELRARADGHAFTIEATLSAHEGESLLRSRSWRERVPRP